MTDNDFWTDQTPRKVLDAVNVDMRAASDAFDLAYHHGGTPRELDKNVTATINALRRVQSAVRREANRREKEHRG